MFGSRRPVGRWQIRKEEKRLAAGWTYEPPTFYTRNDAVTDRPDLPVCRCAEPLPVATPAKPLVHLPAAELRS